MKTPNPEFYGVPKVLREQLDGYMEKLKKFNMDLLLVVDGDEGAGKSATARKVGAYCANKLGSSFGLDNVHYGPQEYLEKSLSMGQYTVHILDEAGVVLGRGSANTAPVKKFVRYLQTAREGNNQVHIIVLPVFHMLDGYVMNHRSHFVIHMYTETHIDTDKGIIMERGAFKLYENNFQLKWAYNEYVRKKEYNYPKNWALWDRFGPYEPFSDEEIAMLIQKKSGWREDYVKGVEGSLRQGPERIRAKLHIACHYLNKELKMPISDIASLLSANPNDVSKWVKLP